MMQFNEYKPQKSETSDVVTNIGIFIVLFAICAIFYFALKFGCYLDYCTTMGL